MKTRYVAFAAAGVLLIFGSTLSAQQFTVFDRSFQIHGFVSQGFLTSNQNNYLTMRTDGGSFSMTDGGLNIATKIADRFRVGVQIYDRKVGALGNWHPQLDWALGDYRFADWFGVRAGQVKTTQGLYNDVQDMEFLHTWAIMPQSIYPIDLRASYIAHRGGDIYGTIPVSKKLGSLSYVGYAGVVPDDLYGGWRYGLASTGDHVKDEPTRITGGDLRSSNLVDGLVFGASYSHSWYTATGTLQFGPRSMPYRGNGYNNATVFYTQYRKGKLKLDGEYMRNTAYGVTGNPYAPTYDSDGRSWYASIAYRVSKRLEIGSYHSRYYADWKLEHSDPSNHIFDQTVTARIDLMKNLDLKVEGHFIDGYGNPYSIRGFYTANNPAGLRPTTRLLVLRMGWNF